MKSLTKTLLAFAAVVAISTFAHQAHAQWNPLKQIKDAGKRLDKSVRTEAGNAANSVKRAHGLNYQVRIVNPSNSGSRTLFYTFEGAPQALTNGKIRTHRGTKHGNPVIAFGNGNGQTVRYGLQRGRTYEFKWNRGVLQLYRR